MGYSFIVRKGFWFFVSPWTIIEQLVFGKRVRIVSNGVTAIDLPTAIVLDKHESR
jgi:hypothetical protein